MGSASRLARAVDEGKEGNSLTSVNGALVRSGLSAFNGSPKGSTWLSYCHAPAHPASLFDDETQSHLRTASHWLSQNRSRHRPGGKIVAAAPTSIAARPPISPV